ncbi:Abnormal spindle-like microcephaly-associated protein-like protein [Nymphaea thermarum]|nr:Abnormal spindle-like microcephaly-associated protein-like protein [Nymphaea thermarum]
MEEERHHSLQFSLTSPHAPPPSSSSSSLLRDISNFKAQCTPRNRPVPHPSSPYSIFFTASKQTPATATAPSSSRRCPPSSLSRKKAARRLRAFEVEQSFSSHKVQIKKEKTLNSLERSLAIWLNFLFRDPGSCGCDTEVFNGRVADCPDQAMLGGNGKRDSLPGEKFEIGGGWRNPKRLKNRPAGSGSGAASREAEWTAAAVLRVSLKDVCSLEDLKDRLSLYISAEGRKDVLHMMSHVSKTIDEGRLKMKAHCPVVSDVAMRDKAIKVLMCYNPTWLRIGLHIVFGGDSILPADLTTEKNADDFEEDLFVRMILEKQFFSHAGLAKSYAYNKSVEGNYRPGYYEAHGSVILKRFLLFVLCLDKAKCESSLPLRYGIDGLDGGSALLFRKGSSIKSSRQVILDFLMELMHGEGDLISRLSTLGYKVSYQQPPLAEYDFVVANLINDLGDGVRLCRVVQLLQHDASILAKIMVPSENRKKKLQNCNVAMQYLKQAGVPFVDDDGDLVTAEDIVGGDSVLVLALLWNIFIHLQLPLLVPKDGLLEELSKLNKSHMVISDGKIMPHLDMVLAWIQVICEGYDLKVYNYASLVDGKALVCMIDYYFTTMLHRNFTDVQKGNTSLVPYCDDALQNFDYVQRVNATIGKFPEVLKHTDILDQDLSCNERSVVVLAILVSCLLIGRKNMDQVNLQRALGGSPFASKLKPPGAMSNNKDMSVTCSSDDVHIKVWKNSKSRGGQGTRTSEERARQVIRTYLRCFAERREFLKVRAATVLLQAVVRAWLVSKRFSYTSELGSFVLEQTPGKRSSPIFERYFRYIIERRSFLRKKRAVSVIQRSVRLWITSRCSRKCIPSAKSDYPQKFVFAVTIIQACIRGRAERRRCADIAGQQQNHLSVIAGRESSKDPVDAAVKIQVAWRRWKKSNFMSVQHTAATRIQSSWRGWLTRKNFQHQQVAAVKIQSRVRTFLCQQYFNSYNVAAVAIQRHIRRSISEGEVFGMRWWRKLLAPSLPEQSAITIQAHIRAWIARRNVTKTKSCVVVIQRRWKNILLWKQRERTAILIQSYIRRWIARRVVEKAKLCIITIQSHWRGHLARRELHLESRDQLLDLRVRMQKSAANIDDGMRLMNRLIDAHHTLSALLNSRKVTGILHTCETLDMATHLSQKCCETLAETGAVETLLLVFQIGNRSVPYVEVLTRALSTLRNLARYPHIVQVLIRTNGLLKIVLEELLWHKEEGYFIAAELLQKICAFKEGVEAIRSKHFFVKRLHNLAEDLRRKAIVEKKQNGYRRSTKYSAERRLSPAKEILSCILNN